MCRCPSARKAALIHLAADGDAGLSQDVHYLEVAQTGSVVLEGEMIFLFVDAEFPQAVGVGKFTEAAELFKTQR